MRNVEVMGEEYAVMTARLVASLLVGGLIGSSAASVADPQAYRMMVRTSRPENFEKLAAELLADPDVSEFRIAPTGD